VEKRTNIPSTTHTQMKGCTHNHNVDQKGELQVS